MLTTKKVSSFLPLVAAVSVALDADAAKLPPAGDLGVEPQNSHYRAYTNALGNLLTSAASLPAGVRTSNLSESNLTTTVEVLNARIKAGVAATNFPDNIRSAFAMAGGEVASLQISADQAKRDAAAFVAVADREHLNYLTPAGRAGKVARAEARSALTNGPVEAFQASARDYAVALNADRRQSALGVFALMGAGMMALGLGSIRKTLNVVEGAQAFLDKAELKDPVRAKLQQALGACKEKGFFTRLKTGLTVIAAIQDSSFAHGYSENGPYGYQRSVTNCLTFVPIGVAMTLTTAAIAVSPTVPTLCCVAAPLLLGSYWLSRRLSRGSRHEAVRDMLASTKSA